MKLRAICQSDLFPRMIELGVQPRVDPSCGYGIEYAGVTVFRFDNEDHMADWLSRHASAESIVADTKAEYEAALAEVAAKREAEAAAAALATDAAPTEIAPQP